MTMPFLTWEPKFSVGIAEIDNQHKKIIELSNVLYAAVTKRESRLVISEVVQKIAEYARYHFLTEESLMEKHHYPEADFQEHKKEHENFRVQVEKFLSRDERKDVTLTVDVAQFLSDWLDHHITKIDKKYSPFLNSKGVF
jgi:hemerythrin-like metal-binding protein